MGNENLQLFSMEYMHAPIADRLAAMHRHSEQVRQENKVRNLQEVPLFAGGAAVRSQLSEAQPEQPPASEEA